MASPSSRGARGLFLSLGVAGLAGAWSLAVVNCGGADGSTFDAGATDDGGGATGDGAGGGGGFGTCDGPCKPSSDAMVNAVCGDGRVTDKEGCDDGNAKSGDGCGATCDVEKGWVCPTPAARAARTGTRCPSTAATTARRSLSA